MRLQKYCTSIRALILSLQIGVGCSILRTRSHSVVRSAYGMQSFAEPYARDTNIRSYRIGRRGFGLDLPLRVLTRQSRNSCSCRPIAARPDPQSNQSIREIRGKLVGAASANRQRTERCSHVRDPRSVVTGTAPGTPDACSNRIHLKTSDDRQRNREPTATSIISPSCGLRDTSPFTASLALSVNVDIRICPCRARAKLAASGSDLVQCHQRALIPMPPDEKQ